MPAVPRPSPSRVREALNLVNGTTALGVLLALGGRARLRRRPDGLVLAEGFSGPFPPAGALTVGNVVLTRSRLPDLERRTPGIVAHEGRHAWQYAAMGPWFFPLYTAASAWSWVRSGNPALRNAFEWHAGLVTGGYLAPGASVPPPRSTALLRRWTGRSGAAPSAPPGAAGAGGADA